MNRLLLSAVSSLRGTVVRFANMRRPIDPPL
jgi:hypothetical protein